MPSLKLLAIPLLALTPMALPAQDIDLGGKIAPGKWALAYQRTGEFKPLRLKKRDDGISYTCIDGDARDKIVGWITAKGCTIEKESLVNGIYRLDGQCRLKWWKSHAIPVSVEIRPEAPNRFSLHIKTRNDTMLDFTEHTTATLQGPCESDSAPEAKQNQGTKS